MKDIYRSLPSRISALRHDTNEYLLSKMKRAGWKGISTSHGGIIFALLKYKVLSMKEIAYKVNRDPSTVTTLVNKLVKLGYASYQKNPDDLRSKQVKLTDKGKGLYEEFYNISLDVTDKMVEGIPDEEIDEFLITLDKINKNILEGLNK